MGEFYTLARSQQDDDAWKMVATAVVAEDYGESSLAAAFERFRRELRTMNLDRWRSLDVRVFEGELEVVQEGEAIFRSTKTGVGLVRVWLHTGSNSVEQQDVKHYWLYSSDKWWLVWRPVVVESTGEAKT
jgi:hypothetical protein